VSEAQKAVSVTPKSRLSRNNRKKHMHPSCIAISAGVWGAVWYSKKQFLKPVF